MTVIQALNAVMNDVQSIAKRDRNSEQNFNFRGIDAVINTVGPALRQHGVIVVPQVEDFTAESYTTKRGTAMRNVTVKVRWVFHGPDGDSIEAVTFGEAADSGDKALSKAQSVAYRIALLQALCIPTDEPDPDASSHERGLPVGDVNSLRAQIAGIGRQIGWGKDRIEADFAEWSQGQFITDVDAATLTQYRDYLDEERKRGAREHKGLVADVRDETQAGRQRKDSPDRGRVERTDTARDPEFEVEPA